MSNDYGRPYKEEHCVVVDWFNEKLKREHDMRKVLRSDGRAEYQLTWDDMQTVELESTLHSYKRLLTLVKTESSRSDYARDIKDIEDALKRKTK